MKRPIPRAAIIPLLLVFILGVAVGALAMSYIHHSAPPSIVALNKATVQSWKRELNLTDRQQHELELTLDDLMKYYGHVLGDGKDRIMAIMDDGQKAKFERLLQEKRKTLGVW